MKRIVLPLVALALLVLPGCYKNDINDLQDEVAAIKEQLKNYETLLNALNKRLYVTEYSVKEGYYVIKLSDGTTMEVRNKTSFITIGANGNWFIDGVDTGKPSSGQAPEIKIGANGHWIIGGTDTGIVASGQSGKDAPAIVSIAVVNGIMTFTFSDGQTITLQTQSPQVSITIPAGGFQVNKWQWLRITPQVKYTDNATYAWIIGEDTVSRDKDLFRAFAQAGPVQLKLVAKNGVGKDEQTIDVLVNAQTYTTGVSKVFEYLPAPGQFTNSLPAWVTGETPAQMATKAETSLKANSIIGLGGYGGYVVMGFDHVILNGANKRDFRVKGNAFANNAEPGIIMVSADVNQNGLPDDEWYEIAGSEYNNPAATKNYEITYYKPDPLNGNVRWTDNKGAEGFVLRNNFHTQASYYPLWYTGNTLTFKGTLLPNNAKLSGSTWSLPAYAWGYVDNQANTSEEAKIDIDWAVDKDGKPVKLQGINFIKVFTGVNQSAGALGETSTEVGNVEEFN
jgi:hypothetical protein